ncbi:hydrogenase accessory protein hypB [Nocardia nova SH22a]|uniref:Hydrogenase accessory protein hypB n=1 Tax=Nocardia nova SH22a TaxID=1415166 RepID=W5TEZ2_9NOCA|nr:hydrogenase nickel incorporation protein HypB [Nocardia nova]AHH17802.1 hydrogenase accessory protein hypB [Nocardia nova SH22a]
MCATCGCGEDSAAVITVPHDHDHDHDHGPGDHHHGHDHGGGHDHGPHTHDGEHEHVHLPATETVTLEEKVLAKNDELAQRNRQWLATQDIVALNVTSSPGAGKTTLLERTVREVPDIPVAVVEGDQETLLDAERIRATGARVVQINTGAGCHLDAQMVRQALDSLEPPPGSVVFIENVGNLVCPALFDLGERAKVVIVSVTEGTDKPLKYPHMFAAAGLVLINKVDLLPYVDFDLDRCVEYARSVNPGVTILPVSATTGAGMADWYRWLGEQYRSGEIPPAVVATNRPA